MSLFTSLEKYPVAIEEKDFRIEATVKHKGINFTAYADCHPEDRDLFSARVGSTIAHWRTIKTIMEYEASLAKQEWEILSKNYYNLLRNYETAEDLDPTGKFRQAMWKADNRYWKYTAIVKELDEEISKYLQTTGKVFTSIRKRRAKEK